VTSTAVAINRELSPVTRWVRKLEQETGSRYYLAHEVADELNCSVQAIRKYAANKVCGKGVAPSERANFGKIIVNLYTPDDIEALRAFLANRTQVWKTSEEEC